MVPLQPVIARPQLIYARRPPAVVVGIQIGKACVDEIRDARHVWRRTAARKLSSVWHLVVAMNGSSLQATAQSALSRYAANTRILDPEGNIGLHTTC
jgi:hypothetical protein